MVLNGGKLFAATRVWVYHGPPKGLGALIRKTIWYAKGDAQLGRKYPNSGYRPSFRGPLHGAGYLMLRTLLLVPLMFVKVSWHHRRPALQFRPLAALLSYVGAWVYCLTWFGLIRVRVPQTVAATGSGHGAH